MSSPSLYERLGGEAAIAAALDLFYDKILVDQRVNHFFEGVDIDRQIAKGKAFLNMAFGGPNNYNGVGLREGHRHLVARGLSDAHFDAFCEVLNTTLTELKVPADLVSEVMAAAEGARTEVLNR